MPQQTSRSTENTADNALSRNVRSLARRFAAWSRFGGNMITHESRLSAWRRRTFSSRRPTLRHLDVHVTDHCNLGCSGCEHYSPICSPALADVRDVKRQLQRLSGLFENIEQIYLLGGEPLLHPQVHEFVRSARNAFPRARLCLMTNGILVTRMPPAVWEALNECQAVLLCDDYPIKLPKAEMERLANEHGVPLEWMPAAKEFLRAPIVPDGSCNPTDSYVACRWLSNCAILRDGRLFPCARAAYADAPASAFGLPQISPTARDSFDIYSGGNGDDAIEFLSSPIPWCRFCGYDRAESYPWARTKKARSEWICEEQAATAPQAPEETEGD